MKKKKKGGKSSGSANAKGAKVKPAKRQARWAIIGLVLAISCLAAAVFFHQRSSSLDSPAAAAYVPRAAGSITFTKDIAPVVFDKCSRCHRPGQSAPFSLLGYEDVKKRVKAIHDAVESRFMPPWLPEPGYAQFAGDASLTSEQRGLLLQWLAEGAAEGRPKDLPELPKWPGEWQLGPPDLVISLPSAYMLASEGKDVYRNFVVPIPSSENRFVRAVEFHPGNAKVVHHAFVEVDSSRQSRFLTGSSQPPGFDGMELPPSVHMPMGQLLGWQPGKPAMRSPEGLSWVLEKRSDLVLQLHLHPSGKPETVLPSVGFYFTDRAPTNTLFLLKLARYTIDIPAGKRDYVVEDNYVLPIDVDLFRLNPHTHYLGKRIEGWAVLPDGIRKDLLLIKNWDFNWQGDYPYQDAIPLPKGTTLFMRLSFDNSAENVHNPSQPPKQVRFGLQTTDEMAELWFQVLPHNRNDLALLSNDFFMKHARNSLEAPTLRLQTDPRDAAAHLQLGSALFSLGQVAEGMQHLRAAATLDPNNPLPHSQLGFIYLQQKMLPEAQAEFEAVLRANPEDYEAQGSLGLICMEQRRYTEAEAFFLRALEINPEDPVSSANLQAIRKARNPQR
jgi:Flp pilus assembly protein TadD